MNYHLLVYDTRYRHLNHYTFLPEMVSEHSGIRYLEITKLPEWDSDYRALILVASISGIKRQGADELKVTQGLQKGDDGFVWLIHQGSSIDAIYELFYALDDSFEAQMTELDEQRKLHQKTILKAIKGSDYDD